MITNEDENVAYEFIRVNNNYFEIYYTTNAEIKLKYINLLKLKRLYQMKIDKNFITQINEDSFELYEEIKKNLVNNNFTLIRKGNILQIEIELNKKINTFTLFENSEVSNAFQKIKETLEIQMNNISKIHNEIQNKNNPSIYANQNLNIILNKGNNEDIINNSLSNLDEENDENNIFSIHNNSKESSGKINLINNLKIESDLHHKDIIKNVNKNNNDLKYDNYYDSLKNYSSIKSISDKSFSINDFNFIYGTSIESANITKLDLSSKKQGNILIKNLNKMNFQNLEELILYENEITDLSPLIDMKLGKLHTLQLFNNKISDISPLEKITFNHLKKLYLQNNNIEDISPLIKLNCIELEILHLDSNKISDISPLTKVRFSNLKKLTLHKNKIKDINAFENVPFNNLELLTLNDNNIIDINVFKRVYFRDMQTLYLFNNNFNIADYKECIDDLKQYIHDYL